MQNFHFCERCGRIIIDNGYNEGSWGSPTEIEKFSKKVPKPHLVNEKTLTDFENLTKIYLNFVINKVTFLLGQRVPGRSPPNLTAFNEFFLNFLFHPLIFSPLKIMYGLPSGPPGNAMPQVHAGEPMPENFQFLGKVCQIAMIFIPKGTLMQPHEETVFPSTHL